MPSRGPSRICQGPRVRASLPQPAGLFRGLGGGGVGGHRPPALSCPCCPTDRHPCAQRVLHTSPLNVIWKSQLCRRCQPLMSLIPSGPSVFRSSSLRTWSQPLWLCDGDNGSGRWAAPAPFPFTVPRRGQGRRHLEGEGQIITEIYTNKLPGLDGLQGRGEEWSSA